MKKIIIVGAGLSGLTVAHELIEAGFEVEVYESDSIPGGMARSFRDSQNIPTEHSWRGYGPFYYNTYDILGRISTGTMVNKNEKIELGIKEYSITEIKKHNNLNDGWIIYKGLVYNITPFIKKHPGGTLIKNALGRDISLVWKEFNVGWHSKIISTRKLKKYLIGKVANYQENSEYSLTVNNNLVPLEFDLIGSKNNNTPKISITDYPGLFYKFIKQIYSNKRKEYYFTVPFKNSIKNICKNTREYLFDFLCGPGYGFDKDTISIGHYFLVLKYIFFTKKKRWDVMNAPTNEAWIDKWVDLLESKGVKFHFDSTLEFINVSQNSIQGININGLNVTGDDYIIAINPNNLEDIFKKSEMSALELVHKNIKTINNQISFRIGFDKKINILKKGYVLLKSPWNITFYCQEKFWAPDIYLGDGVLSLISGTVIISYQKGLNGKTAMECTIQEFLEEVVNQFFNDSSFTNIVNVSIDNIIVSNISPDYFWNGSSLESKNKKWVNNITNEKYRPGNKTDYLNMYLAGAHTRTSFNIWSMEGAIESGKLASNLILSKYSLEECAIFIHNKKKNIISLIDDYFYDSGLPHFIDLITILLILLLIISIVLLPLRLTTMTSLLR
jgi:uncharacterized protein with NAD-binding domain and iron-sulfur cluster